MLTVDSAILLIGAEGARLLREKVSRETPQALKRRGGSRTPRGKGAPGAEINRLVLQSKKNKKRPCICRDAIFSAVPPRLKTTFGFPLKKITVHPFAAT